MVRAYHLPFSVDVEFRAQQLGAGALRNTDFIRQLIERDIKHFNIINIEQRDLHVLIGNVQDASKVYDKQSNHIGWARYSFGKWTSDPEPLDINVDEDCKALVPDETRWIPVSDWLQRQAEAEVDVWEDAERNAASHQREQWNNSGVTGPGLRRSRTRNSSCSNSRRRSD